MENGGFVFAFVSHIVSLHFKTNTESMKITHFILAFLFSSSIIVVSSYDPFNPQNNPSDYPPESLIFPGSAFPFSNQFPSPRFFHTIDANSDYLFVYGGYSTNGTILGDMNLYHIPSQRWSGPIVKEECCNENGEEIESIGITIDLNIRNISYLRRGFQGDFPLPRAEHATCVINEILYLFGGNSEKYGVLNDLYTFNSQDLSWQILDMTVSIDGAMPVRRAGHSFVSDINNQRCILFGGRQYSLATNSSLGLSDIWSFDVNRLQWQRLDRWNINSRSSSATNNLPLGKQHVAATITNDHFYIFGGSDPVSGRVYDDLWMFDMTLSAWKQLYPYPSSTIETYAFAPPAMEHAHLLPSVLGPVLNDNDEVYFQNNDDNNDHTDNGQSRTIPTTQRTSQGLLIYGGIGSGGNCIHQLCHPLQTTIGQLYFFSFQKQTWVSPFVNIHENLQPSSETTSHWLYCQLHHNNNINGQKYLKNYLYEQIVYLPTRNMIYEFGGIVANVEEIITNHQQETPTIVRFTSIQGDDDVITSVSAIPIIQSVGGEITADSQYSDTQTGSYLEDNVGVPTNAFWTMQQILFNGSIFQDQAITNQSRPFLFQSTLRSWIISATDMTLAATWSFP
jgi:hypothetical protein